MKKLAIITALVAAAMTSCVIDGPGAKTNEGPTKEITFEIATDGIYLAPTRVAQIYSSDALQAIEQVQVYVFNTPDNGTSWKFYRKIDMDYEWIQGQNKLVHKLKLAEMLPMGKYRFLAVGTDNFTDYTINSPAVGDDYNTMTATLAAAIPQEIFSGYKDKEFSQSMETVTIIMGRRVAGVLLYAKNIPTKIEFNDIYGNPQSTHDVKFLRLTVAGSNKQLDIIQHVDDLSAPMIGILAGYNVFNVDLSAQGDADNDGIWDGTPNVGGVQKMPNSTLVGAYIVPFSVTKGVTMTLALIDPNNVVLKQWTVKNMQGQITYNIHGNFFYSIGKKLQSANTNNGSDAEEDDDDPIDLSKAQTIVPSVVAGWRNTYPMIIEEVDASTAR